MLRFRGERMDVMKLPKLLTLAKQQEVDLPRKDEKQPEVVGEPGKDKQQLGERNRRLKKTNSSLQMLRRRRILMGIVNPALL